MPPTTFTLEFDPSVGAAPDAFAITTLPTLSLSATLDAAVSEPVQFGFADATATGTAKLNTTVGVELVDPDSSGRLTGSELALLDVDDVVALHLGAAAPDDVDIDLSLTADVAGTQFGGTLSVSDASLFADPPADISVSPVGANPIDLLANINPETAITSLTQLISSLGVAMTGGDVKLPFLADGVFVPADLGDDAQAGFDRVFEVVQPILDYVEPRAAGQIVCGTMVPDPPSPDEDGIPFGSIRDLKDGDAVFCRAFTADEGGAGGWTVDPTVASLVTADASLIAASVGKTPTRNVEFEMNADGDFKTSASFTPTGGNATTILPRAATIQDLIQELVDADLLSLPDDVDYNSDLESFEFPIGTSVAGPIERAITVDAGSSLVADTGLTGLSGGAGAQAKVTIENIDAGITLGLIATDDEADINPDDNSDDPEIPGEDIPGPGDRFYVRSDGPVVSVGDVTLDGDVSMIGRLGFLEVSAVAGGTLGPNPNDDDPALAVGLPAATGVTVGGNSDPDATLVRDLLTEVGLDSITPEVNLQFDGSIAVSTQMPGGSSLGGSIEVLWDLDDPSPEITFDTTDFQDNLLPFEGGQKLTHVGAANADETIFTTSPGLLSMAGLVGSQLVDPDTKAVCNITSVISDTTLRCENPEPDDGDPLTDVEQNPIDFEDGVEYRVAGNTLANLVEILDAIDRLADYLETALGNDAFSKPLPIVGVTPGEIVGQIATLRKMVDEFRGVQDAQITCSGTVPGDPDPIPIADIRAIALGAGDTATLECHAASSSASVSAVRWRITGDGQNTSWVDADAGTVGPGQGTVELAVKAPGTGHDGFVSLGSEYTIEVEWTEGTELKSAALPPRTPQSLQSLAKQVSQVLGLPDGALEFALDDTDPANRMLRINLGYGICSNPAPSDSPKCAGMPTAPAPSAELQLDLGNALPSLVGFETGGDIVVKFAALGQFDLGIPLDGDSPVLYGSTGLEARVQVDGTALEVTASIGPVSATLGAQAGGTTGTVTEDSATTLVDANATFTDQTVPVGATIENTTTHEECFASALTDGQHVECALEWHDGDGYKIGGQGGLHAGLSFELGVGDPDDDTDDDNTFPIDDTTPIHVSGIDEFLAGDADCGGIYPGSDKVLGTGDTDLAGIVCARASMALGVGNAQIYLGELGLDLVGTDLTVFVPADLDQKLEDALLDPAFLVLAIPELLKEVEGGLRDAADSGAPAAIADPLRSGADAVGALRQGAEELAVPLADILRQLPDPTDLDQITTAIEDHLTQFLQDALNQSLSTADAQALDAIDTTVTIIKKCGDDLHDCGDGDSLLTLTDIAAQITFGQEIVAGTGLNLGLPGLPLSIEGGVEAFATWQVTVGAGVSRDDGPYIALDPQQGPDGDEVSVDVGLRFNDQGPDDCAGTVAMSVDDITDNIPDRPDAPDYDPANCLRGRLAFLFVTAIDEADPGSGITAHLGFNVEGSDPDRITLPDILGGDLDVEFTLDGDVHFNLHVRTGIGEDSPDLPTVLGTFHLDWSVELGEPVPSPDVGFDDLHLDLGTFLKGFLEPIAKEVKNITGPLQPIIDTLMAPIPVVSDLAELVGSDPITMISLLEAATGADLSLVKAIARYITFFNNLPTDVGQIPLGGLLQDDNNSLSASSIQQRAKGQFKVDTAAASTSVSSTEAGKLIKQGPGSGYTGGSGFATDVGGEPGTTDGRPSTFGVPGLSFPFLDDASQIFGILVGRDATLIRWDAGTMEAKAGFSYDFGPIMVGPVPITITVGGEIGVRGRFAIGYDTSGIRQLLDGGSGVALFDGIFIDDLDAQGNDVPEVTFFGKVFAAASVDLVIVSAGVRGGIELTFSLDLDDRPDPDGKLRILEIVDKLQNPICLFVVSGKIEAFLEAFVKIDLFFFTEEFSFELVRVTLLEWSSACEPPKPELAGQDGNVLYLNVGDRRHGRNIKEGETEEKLEVRQIGAGKVRVSGYGFEEVHSGVDLIVADGGSDADELLFLPGTDEGSTDVERPFTIPVVVSGGSGDDIIKTGEAPDKIFGDAAITDGSWQNINYHGLTDEGGAAGHDTVNAGAGDDLVSAGGGNDTVEGEFGKDSLLGEGGDDSLKGGPGDDSILGGANNDSLQGGPIEQPAPNTDADDDDGIVAGGGQDVVSAEFGNDVVFGDNAAGFFTTASDGRLSFTSPGLDAWRNSWCPDTGGSTDGDILTGTDGDDTIVGGGGADKIDAGVGNDHACGGPGNDEVLGAAGDDELRGDADNDVLTGAEDDDLIFGGTGNDQATGDAGDDDMFGDDGADIFKGNDGDDVVVGDGGSVADTSIDGVGTSGQVDVDRVQDIDDNTTRESTSSNSRRADCNFASGTDNSDCLYGGAGSDALFGGSDGDFAYGESGVDLLEGNDGPDELRGGTENDLLLGRADTDDLYGDGGADQAFGDRTIDEWESDTPSDGVTDHLFGGPDPDRLEGDGGADEIFGGAANDHAEGNDGDDSIFGEGANDDLIGGSDMAGVADVGETLVSGGEGQDVIAGDNATITPHAEGYVLGRHVTLLDPTIGGDDTIEGDADKDAAFGEVGNDTMWGDHGPVGPFLGVGAPDYLEGDDGDDEIHGEAGTDDIVGGNSAEDGNIVAGRDGTAQPDGGETLLDGGAARDWIAGDNARLDRVLLDGPDYPEAATANPIKLFDLATVTVPAVQGSFGGDTVTGGDQTDLIFGQGGNDTLNGDAGPDYVEGNDGNDTIHGGAADDDLMGGGSANNGLIDALRVGDTLLDVGETIVTGDAGLDWITGDNALVNRNVLMDGRAPIELFDVQSAFDEAPVIDPGTSGGDLLQGNGGNDRIFGQGNGAQPATQTDPADGRNNDFVAFDEFGDPDPDAADFDRSTGDADEDGDGVWLGDVILGGVGDDEIEGNHGNDLIFGDGTATGGQDEDDIAGGGSADDGKIDDDVRLNLGANLLDGADTIHGDSTDDEVGDDDAAIGDNGWVKRLDTIQHGNGPETGDNPDEVDIVGRDVQMVQVQPLDGTYGNDFVAGNGGHDEVYGQAGDDAVEGGWGSDAVIGDLAKVTTDLLGVGDDSTCTPPRTIQPKEPFVTAQACQPGTLFRLVELYAFDDTLGGVVNGSDVLLGGDGDDWMHGGAGRDHMQGDGDGADFTTGPLPGVQYVVDPNLASADVDRMFGGDSNGTGAGNNPDPVLGGNGDAIWGGRGNDHTYGGRGDDMLDVHPDPNPAVQFPKTWEAWAEADVESFHDIDIAYGGYDQDAMQANIADQGPTDGDRMFDWVGVYNILYLCPATYGAYLQIRDQNPALIEYLLEQAETDGALTPDVKTSSGGNEIAMVYKPDVKFNNAPVYPGTPGHFFCPS
jgi:Ca2+-binding RTX toxin-like protein